MRIILDSYSFNAAAKQVTLTQIPTPALNRILLVSNITRDIIIFCAETNTGKGGTLAGQVLTLEYDTSSQSNSDTLRIIYEDASASQTVITGGLTDAQLRASPVPVSGTFFQATQPISGTVTANTGLSQPLTNSELRATPVPISGTVSTGLSQPLTDAELRATPVPVSLSSAPLATGASTSALQTTGNSSLSSIDGKLPALVGGAIPVTGTITATIDESTLATSAKQDTSNTKLDTLHSDLSNQATSAKQDTAAGKLDTLHTDLNTTIHGDLTSTNTKLDTIHSDIGSSNTKLDTLHSDLNDKATATLQGTTNTKLDTLHTDLGITLHSDIGSTNTKLDTLHSDISSTNTKLDTLNTNVSTSAKQDTGNTSLSNIDGKIPSKGTALIAASTPVNIASDQVIPVVLKDGSGNTLGNFESTNSDAEAVKTGASVLSTESYQKMFNGTTWDRVRGDVTNGLYTQVKVQGSNLSNKFRDGFLIASPDTSIWDRAYANQGTTFDFQGGNSSGSAYLGISMCPFTGGSEYLLETKQGFSIPTRFISGISASQRIVGQELEISLVGVDGNNAIEDMAAFNDLAISGTITIASNIATINFASAHGLRGGDRVLIKGCTEKRLNVGPVTVTVVTALQITVPCTLANGTYTAGGYIEWADPCKRVKNAFGMLLENSTATNASVFTRRNGSSIRSTNSTIATTAATQANASPYSDAWNSGSQNEFAANIQEEFFISRPQDSVSAASGQQRYTQTIIDESNKYKIRIRAKNLSNFANVCAKIATASKSASTTATITTSSNHGLTTGDYVQIYGILDQTNFANMTTSTAVTVTGLTTFTVAFGASYTGSSTGGIVVLNNGSATLPGAINLAIASIQRTSNVLTVTMNTSSTGLVAGEWCHLYGLVGTNGTETASDYEGAYRVLRQTGSTYELESVGANFSGSVTTGGAVIKRTDFRIHYVMEMEHARHIVELQNAQGSSDANRAMPVVVATMPTVSANVALQTISGATFAGHGSTTTGMGFMPTAGVTGLVHVVPSFSAGSTTPADGTNSLVYDAFAGRDCEWSFEQGNGNASNTWQMEGSNNGVNWFVLPINRVNSLATSMYYLTLTVATPASSGYYRGRTYGFAKLRFHQTARTTAGTAGLLTIVPNSNSLEQSISFFSLNAASTSEVAGTASYVTAVTAISGGGVRTMKVIPSGAAKAIMQIDAVTGTLTLGLEGSPDGGTTWAAITTYPVGGVGGAGATTYAITGTTAQPQSGLYEADVSIYTDVRVHCSAYTGGAAYGALKIIPSVVQVDSSFGLINSANTTNLTSLKNAGGLVTSIALYNNGASDAYFKLYNKASAPAPASDTPIEIIGLKAGTSRDVHYIPKIRLGLGIAYSIVGGAGNTDTTVVAANQVTGGIIYA